MKYDELPYPRLELVWRASTPEDEMPTYEWACEYWLVLYPPTVSDCRSNSEDGEYAANDVRFLLNTSYRGCDEPPYPGDTPYRDGVHAARDSLLLDIPAFVYNGQVWRDVDIYDNIKHTLRDIADQAQKDGKSLILKDI